MKQYKRAPITEAVIEIRLEQPVSKKLVDSVLSRLKDDYAASHSIAELGVKLNVAERQATVDQQNFGYKLNSEDEADVLILASDRVTCSRLAPYVGWEKFSARAVENWDKWKRIVKYQRIQRIGLRYINRIDVPVINTNKIKIENYLNIYPIYPEPEVISGLGKYTMQLVGPYDVENCSLIINTSVIPSPLVSHLSLVLDLDLGWVQNVPQNDREMWNAFGTMRDHKNRIFEACVTDNSRRLFEE